MRIADSVIKVDGKLDETQYNHFDGLVNS